MIEPANSNDDIDASFPFQSYRPGQKECIQQAMRSLYEQDYGLFVIDAPVGVGKSPILVGIGNYIGKDSLTSFYSTPQIILQSQLERDFSTFVPQIKAARNYRCVLAADGSSCDVGKCHVDLWNKKKPSCPYYPRGKNVDAGCEYFHARYNAMNSAIRGVNISYLTRAKFLGDRDLLMVDEAHNASEWCIDDMVVKIKEFEVDPNTWSRPGAGSFDSYVDWLENHVIPDLEDGLVKIKIHIDNITSENELKSEMRKSIYAERVLNKTHELVSDYRSFGNEWIVKRGIEEHVGFISFMPVVSSRFLKNLLWCRGKKVIVSSGTIVPEFYIKEAGLDDLAFDPGDCVFKGKSPFPKERSPIYYLPAGKMSFNEKEQTFPRIMKLVNDTIRARQDRRGIIHSFTYSNSKYVVDHIDPDLKHLIVVQDREKRDESLNRWLSDERDASVFVSTAMTEGIDLKDDLARYQIYVKVGYPDMNDPRVKKRIEMGHREWYSYQAIQNIEQSSGRATRSVNDWSEMFIFDESFGNLLEYNEELFKEWFIDRLVHITALVQPPRKSI